MAQNGQFSVKFREILQSYKQERGYLMHFVRLATGQHTAKIFHPGRTSISSGFDRGFQNGSWFFCYAIK